MATVIRTYGLLWRAENVFWNRSGYNGQLLGHPIRQKAVGAVNFANQIGIYVLYRGTDIVYVGQTGAQRARLYTRLRKHTKDHLAGRWDHFSWFGLRGLKNTRGGGKELAAEAGRRGDEVAKVLDHIEAVMIAATEPPLNKQGGRFGKGSLKILQVRDPKLGLTDRQLLEAIYEALE